LDRIESSEISLIVYDFDGVMTDNKVYLNQDGKEMVQVNRADGLGISMLAELEFEQIILSTERNIVVQKRADKLGIPCIGAVDDKLRELKAYCRNKEIALENVLYIGNDINDIEVMRAVGWPLCPCDAHKSIRDISKFVMTTSGGNGVIRELLDIIKNGGG